jgi:hypothetical protein
MAKAKPNANQNSEGRGTKSAAIRELLTQDPKMPVNDVVATLAGRNVKVNSNLVYYVKGRMKTHQRRQQRRQAAEAGQRFGDDPVAMVRRVKALADQVGGIKNLKQLVDLLAE